MAAFGAANPTASPSNQCRLHRLKTFVIFDVFFVATSWHCLTCHVNVRVHIFGIFSLFFRRLHLSLSPCHLYFIHYFDEFLLQFAFILVLLFHLTHFVIGFWSPKKICLKLVMASYDEANHESLHEFQRIFCLTAVFAACREQASCSVYRDIVPSNDIWLHALGSSKV